MGKRRFKKQVEPMQFHGIRYLPFLQSEMDEHINRFKESSPPPSPPKKAMTPAQFGLEEKAGAVELGQRLRLDENEAEERYAAQLPPYEDWDDPEYQQKLSEYNDRLVIQAEDFIINRCVLFDIGGELFTMSQAKSDGLDDLIPESDDAVNLVNVIHDPENRWLFWNDVHDNSVLTWRSVLREAEKIGIKRNGKPILDCIPRNNDAEPQPLTGMAASAAMKLGVMYEDFCRMPIKKQASTLAQYLVSQWQEYWSSEDAYRKAKSERRI